MKSLLAAFVLLVLMVPAAFAGGGKRSDEVQRLQRAAEVFKEIMAIPDKAIPDDLLNQSECIAIVPGLSE